MEYLRAKFGTFMIPENSQTCGHFNKDHQKAVKIKILYYNNLIIFKSCELNKIELLTILELLQFLLLNL